MSLSKTVVLADPTQRVPWPGVPGRVVTGSDPIAVSVIEPFWASLIADGTLVDPPAPPVDAPAKPPKS